MDDITLEYITHFETLTALQKMEIVSELYGNAAASGVQGNEIPGVLQFLRQIETTSRRINANLID